MWKNLAIILIIFIINSCIDEQQSVKLTFNDTVEMKADLISDESPLMSYPFDMFVTESMICVLCLMNQQWIHCFDKETGEYLSGHINQGRGPGEMLSCVQMYYDRDSDELYLFDNATERLLTFSISDRSAVVAYKGEVSFAEVPQTVFMKAWPLSADTILANVQCGSLDISLTRLQIYTIDGQLLETCSDMPALEGDDRYTYQQTSMTLAPDCRHFASLTLFGEILEIYDLYEDTIRHRLEKVYAFPCVDFIDGVLWETDQTVLGFPFACSDNDYIYASMIDGSEADVFDKIAIFDWKGNGVMKVLTDYNVLRLSSFEDSLYAIVANSANDLFFAKYDLKMLNIL